MTTEATKHAVATDASNSAQSTLEAIGAAGRVKWLTTKRDFRARAHSNPLNDGMYDVPLTPREFHLTLPRIFGENDSPAGALNVESSQKDPHFSVDWCDIGCGYGGLLASLSVAFPEKYMIGMEIRERVAEFCVERVKELRKEYGKHGEPKKAYTNIGFLRTNAMKYLPNYFRKGELEKLFFCYPDPHFKRKKHRQRIISDQLLAEYAYVLKPEVGIAYIVTDVPELFQWMDERFTRCPLFRKRTAEEIAQDSVAVFVRDMTDEAARVEKSDRPKLDASYVRISSGDSPSTR